jgi:predicted dienelactone hydrolase
MRFFEVLTMLSLAVAAGALMWAPARRARIVRWLSLAAGVSIMLHLALEGLRWQMVPAYALAIVFTVISLRAMQAEPGDTTVRPWLRRTGAGLSLLLIGVSAACAALLPVFELAPPEGVFGVGTMTLHLVDSSRAEIITERLDDRRELIVQVWYPARVSAEAAADPAPYIAPEVGAAYANKYGLPAFATSHLNRVETHAYRNAPLADAQRAYPVLLFSHGYNVPPALYTSFLVDMASRGYVVASVNHTYESTAAAFPDGRVATFSHAFVLNTHTAEMWAQIDSLEQQYRRSKGAERLATLRTINRIYPNADMMRRWATDLSFVIDELTRLHAEETASRFHQRLDLTRIGAFGHSAGGAAAGQVLLVDDRVRAGVNWDGAQWGDAIDAPFTQPFMMITADWDSTKFQPNPLIYRQGSETAFYDLTIRGTGHSSFSDIPRLIPLQAVNQAGPIAPERAARITTAYTSAFFDRHLEEENKAWPPDVVSTFPEVRLTVRRGGATAGLGNNGSKVLPVRNAPGAAEGTMVESQPQTTGTKDEVAL